MMEIIDLLDVQRSFQRASTAHLLLLQSRTFKTSSDFGDARYGCNAELVRNEYQLHITQPSFQTPTSNSSPTLIY